MIVLDASMLMAALLADEKHRQALELYGDVLDGREQVIVPPIFLYESCNAVIQAMRRARVDKKTAAGYLDDIYGFPVQLDDNQAIQEVTRYAIKHALTVYDASYLELCKREALPLATLDNALMAAAGKEKIPVLAD